MQVLGKSHSLKIKLCTGYRTRPGLHLHAQKRVPRIQILFDPMAAPHSKSSSEPDNDQICLDMHHSLSSSKFQIASASFRLHQHLSPTQLQSAPSQRKQVNINMHARYLAKAMLKMLKQCACTGLGSTAVGERLHNRAPLPKWHGH